MAAKFSKLTHKIATQLHLVAESCTRWPVQKLLDTYDCVAIPWIAEAMLLECLENKVRSRTSKQGKWIMFKFPSNSSWL